MSEDVWRTALSYNDILLVPAPSNNDHVSDADISMEYDKCPVPFTANTPIINSPMDMVCSKELLVYFIVNNIPITIHRYYENAEEQIKFFVEMWTEAIKQNEQVLKTNGANIFITVGSVYKYNDWIDKLLNYRVISGIKFGIGVDMANGDTKACIDTVKYIRNAAKDANIMAGNIATKGGYTRLEEAGANFIRVGIGGGCFIGDTLVFTKKGEKKIKDVKIGDRVLTHLGTFEEVEDKLNYNIDGELLYTINGNITCTENHEFYVIENKYVEFNLHNFDDAYKYAEWKEANKLNVNYSLIKVHETGKDFDIIPITSVESDVATCKVYDLTVKNAHSYFTNRVCVHNSICSTRTTTGFGVPTLTSVLDCETRKTNSYLIADGGCENAGDAIKAIRCGADLVMMGKILASTNLAPGLKYDSDFLLTENENEIAYCQYRGMSSHQARQASPCRKSSSVEGVSGLVKYTGTTQLIVQRIEENMRTAIAYYGGVKNWKMFRKFVKIIRITSAGWQESLTRIIEQ